MPDRMEIKPEHLWITSLIARGIARADEAGLAFHAGGQPDAADAEAPYFSAVRVQLEPSL